MQVTYVKGGWKYRVLPDSTNSPESPDGAFYVQTTLRPPEDILTQFVDLLRSGLLKIKPEFAWDGPSGPVIDDDTNRRSSLIHDALYWLLRHGWLPATDRKEVDRIFRRESIADGIKGKKFFRRQFVRSRAWGWYTGLRLGGARAASASQTKKVRVAP